MRRLRIAICIIALIVLLFISTTSSFCAAAGDSNNNLSPVGQQQQQQQGEGIVVLLSSSSSGSSNTTAVPLPTTAPPPPPAANKNGTGNSNSTNSGKLPEDDGGKGEYLVYAVAGTGFLVVVIGVIVMYRVCKDNDSSVQRAGAGAQEDSETTSLKTAPNSSSGTSGWNYSTGQNQQAARLEGQWDYSTGSYRKN